jgi:hypothetical protein
MKQFSKKYFLAIVTMVFCCLTIFSADASAQHRRLAKRHCAPQVQLMQTPNATIIRIPRKRRANACQPRTCHNRHFRGHRRAMCR